MQPSVPYNTLMNSKVRITSLPTLQEHVHPIGFRKRNPAVFLVESNWGSFVVSNSPEGFSISCLGEPDQRVLKWIRRALSYDKDQEPVVEFTAGLKDFVSKLSDFLSSIPVPVQTKREKNKKSFLSEWEPVIQSMGKR